MKRRHPLRVTLFLAAISVAGIVGQLVLPTGWSAVPLAMMLMPLGFAIIGAKKEALTKAGHSAND